MKNFTMGLITGLSLLLSSAANADQWTAAPGAKVLTISVGASSGTGTNVVMEGTTFAGCVRSDLAFLSNTNPSYDQMLSALMTARVSKLPVRLYYGGCHGNFALIKEVSL